MGFLDLFKRAPASARAAQPLPTRNAPGPFIAAHQDRLTASWMAQARAINEELRSDLDKLRARARDLGKNNDYARKFLRMVARNLVGPAGFTLQCRVEDAPGQPDSAANSAIEAAFYVWARRGSAEITGRQSFADLSRAVAVAVARDGEALVRIVRGAAAGNGVGLALQHIDAGRLDTQMNRAPGNGRNAILMGVEVDEFHRPMAYWIKERVDASTGASRRFPAADMLHIFLPEQAEQARGLPWMHAAMLSMHDLGEFNRSALLAARKGADTLGWLTTPEGTAPADMAGQESASEALYLPNTGDKAYIDVLPEGVDFKAYDSNYPNQVFDPFTKAILRRIASGLDVAYNSLANDLEGVNYSSIRAGVLEERDQWTTLQNWFIDAFLEPVFDEWFRLAMLSGITLPNGAPLPVAKADKFRAHEWQGRRWAWVDPMKDIEAARLAVKSGIASPQMIAAQNGVDVEDVLKSIAAFERMAKDNGVTLVDYGDKPAPAPAPADASTPLP